MGHYVLSSEPIIHPNRLRIYLWSWKRSIRLIRTRVSDSIIYIVSLYIIYLNECMGDVVYVSMSEWLRSLTRNQMGYARAGSNPAADDLLLLLLYIELIL